jgi:outer membrane protein assembly factor BamE (lipoprotein component of BamABCDE complex)
MTRRRPLVFSLLATLTILGVGGWLLWESMKARTVRPGMTLDQVTEILGSHPRIMMTNMRGGTASWHRNDAGVSISFDSDFVVTSVHYDPPFDRVRRWLRL